MPSAGLLRAKGRMSRDEICDVLRARYRGDGASAEDGRRKVGALAQRRSGDATGEGTGVERPKGDGARREGDVGGDGRR